MPFSLTFNNGKITYAERKTSNHLNSPARTSRAVPPAAPVSGPPTAPDGAVVSGGSRRGLELRRAEARRLRTSTTTRVLKAKSIGERQAKLYEDYASRFTQWARSKRFVLAGSAGQLDEALERYLDMLFLAGKGIFDARNTVYGYGFIFDSDVSKKTLPRTHRALKGFSRAAPGDERDPMPWEAAVAMAFDMCSHERATPYSKVAASVLIVSFDGYFRPSETLSVNGQDICVPQARPGLVSITVKPQDSHHEGSLTDVRRAAAGIPRAAPAKSGQHDGTVLFGESASLLADRGFVSELLIGIKKLAPAKKPVFPLTLRQYEAAVKASANRLCLERLSLTPHSARHGGPSEDFLRKVRDIRSIQARGRWEHPRSVARYRKPGKLTRQIAKLPTLLRRQFPVWRKALPATLLAAFKSAKPELS